MTIEEFDATLYTAARDVNFGPMNGFGGHGSSEVFDNLPGPLQELYERWNIPHEILAKSDPGESIRHYAEMCGINVVADLAALVIA